MIKIEAIDDIKDIEKLEDVKCYIDMDGEIQKIVTEFIVGLSFLIDNIVKNSDEEFTLDKKTESFDRAKDMIDALFEIGYKSLKSKTDNSLVEKVILN